MLYLDVLLFGITYKTQFLFIHVLPGINGNCREPYKTGILYAGWRAGSPA